MSRLNALGRLAKTAIARLFNRRNPYSSRPTGGDEPEAGSPPPPPPKRPRTTFDDSGDGGDNWEPRPKKWQPTDDPEAFQQMMEGARHVLSSNVYSYFFDAETPTVGTLYVTFLDYTPRQFDGDGKREGPGPTYAYYKFPTAKFREFQSMANASAGAAVWDYCRVRGSRDGHQHQYRLIQVAGDYVPRKVTPEGFRARQVARLGMGRRNLKRNLGGMPGRVNMQQQLPEEFFKRSNARSGKAPRDSRG